ncbi:MAG: cytochrome-c peroxidase [Planctomycetes bacterium RBG_13_63_9]|nr:MAG: cytochrome-c peroxidase [Planctomycetes bacterium RBG_13_63_9]
MLGAAVLVAGAAEEPGQDVSPDEHGAASVQHQSQVLAKLMPEGDVTKAPPEIDAVVWAAFVPVDNALTPERVALGRKLYFDKRLSKDGTVSCATCHDVTRGLTDQRAVSEGIAGQLGKRNAPTTLNVVLLQTLFLDGRSPSLDHQARMPILNPVEMGMPDEATALKAISDDPEYQKAFRKAYGREMNYEDVGRAIAAFERTLVFMDSPLRRFLAGDTEAISAEAQAGWDLYNGKARCVTCHPMNPSNPLGTDNRFHNVGVSARHQDFESLARRAVRTLQEDASEQKLDELAVGTDLSELGRFMVTRNRADTGAFRTPQILNIAITPPYMHDGSLVTLWDVMDHYNKGGEPNPFLDGGMEPLALTEEEIGQLVALMFTLTDDRFAEENQRQEQQQRAAAQKDRPFRDEDMALRRTLPFEQRVKGAANVQGESNSDQ